MPQEDEGRSKLHHPEEIHWVIFPSNDETMKIMKPCEQTLGCFGEEALFERRSDKLCFMTRNAGSGSAKTGAHRLQALPREGRRTAKIELYRRFFPCASTSEAREFVETYHSAETMAEFQGLLLGLEQDRLIGPTDRVFQGS